MYVFGRHLYSKWHTCIELIPDPMTLLFEKGNVQKYKILFWTNKTVINKFYKSAML